jgi:hypothetical protein
VTIFPLLRPEKSVWQRVWTWVAVLWIAWVLVFWRERLEASHYVLLGIVLGMSIVRELRWRRTPDRRVEIDGESIRLFPEGYWVVDAIRRESILGRRDEGKEFFVHFDDGGTERAVVFERVLFTKEQWEELLGLLKNGTKAVGVEH